MVRNITVLSQIIAKTQTGKSRHRWEGGHQQGWQLRRAEADLEEERWRKRLWQQIKVLKSLLYLEPSAQP